MNLCDAILQMPSSQPNAAATGEPAPPAPPAPPPVPARDPPLQRRVYPERESPNTELELDTTKGDILNTEIAKADYRKTGKRVPSLGEIYADQEKFREEIIANNPHDLEIERKVSDFSGTRLQAPPGARTHPSTNRPTHLTNYTHFHTLICTWSRWCRRRS